MTSVARISHEDRRGTGRSRGVAVLVVRGPRLGLGLRRARRRHDRDRRGDRRPVLGPDPGQPTGRARVDAVAEPTDVSGGVVGWLGGGADSFAVWQRPEGLPAGAYNFVAHYANAEKNTGHPYNTDVITRFLDISEEGGATTRGAYRHNYSWQGFWEHTVPLDLTTDDGALRLGNATGWAPNLDRVALAPLVLEVENRQ